MISFTERVRALMHLFLNLGARFEEPERAGKTWQDPDRAA